MFLTSVTRDKKIPNALQVKILASFKKQLANWSARYEIPKELAMKDQSLGYLLIELDIDWKGFKFKDKLIWDPYNPHSNPEEYACIFCSDIGLDSEWSLVIAHYIRQHILRHFRSIIMIGSSPYKRVPQISDPNATDFQPYPDIIEHQFIRAHIPAYLSAPQQ
jgi:SWI/SNF-related matrix-associated actin-dependent regulator of chromatin subfamily B protein 1